MNRYVANDTNLLREGALSASNALASDAIYRTDTAAKVGGGQAVVTGPYSGAATTDIDIEIVDNAGSTPQVSAPAFSGVGNGTLTDLTVAGIAAQVITITLEDLGTETRKAYAPFQGVTLRAKTAPGNGITIDIDQSGLVLSDTDFALQEDISPGANEYEGTHWDISALGEMTLTPDGKIPATAPRVVFGADPQVYVAFRQYKAGRYVYGFSPSPVRVAVRGTRIHQVTGSRILTVNDGITPEVFTGCGSLYQTLLAIRDGSALVEVEGPVVNDRLPGGQAAVDLSVWTSSYVIGVDPDGSYACLKADLIVTPTSTAPTELLRIQCIDATVTGQEIFRVEGDVTGRLANAITNVLYGNGPYAFTIPLPEIPLSTPGNASGNIQFTYSPQPREESSYPNIKLHKPRLGPAAKNGTIEFTWTQRPDALCTEEGSVSGSPNADCLGINPPGDDNVSDASRLIRAQRLTAAVRALIESNTIAPETVATFDLSWINKSAKILSDCLTVLPGGPTLVLPVWVAAKVYAEDDMVEPVTRNGYRYAAQGNGAAGASQPTWPTSIGATVTDGDVTWVCLGPTPWYAYDEMFDQWYQEANQLAGYLGATPQIASAWTDTSFLAAPGSGIYVRPTAGNGCVYFGGGDVWPDGTTSLGEPDWIALKGSTTSEPLDPEGVAGWSCVDQYWLAEHEYAPNALISPRDGYRYKVSVAGVSGSTEPAWNGGTVTDGEITWVALTGAFDLTTETVDAFFDRYRSSARDVAAMAGLFQDFKFAGVDGDGCWQDPGDAGYWLPPDGYLPFFNNRYGYLCKQFIDEDGNPYIASTHELGFAFQVGCPENLVYGDKSYVTLSDVSGSSTGQGYQEGDTFNVAVQNAVLVPFGGGQTGDDTQTWAVSLSIDGRIDDYSLVTTALAPYAYSDGGASLGFQVTPGGIPFGLGDKFVAEIEGGRFKWRRDGGAWSSNLDIDATGLADGLSVQFNAGIAPSWAAGDRWTYRAESTYGAVQLRTPLDGEMEWSGSTVIALPGGAIKGIGLYRHRIPSNATMTLQGSNDNFSTTPLSATIPWRRDNLWFGVVANYTKYRLSINTSGAIRWLYLGPGTQLQIRTGANELGKLVKRPRLVTPVAPGGLGATIAHEWLPESATDSLLSVLNHAAEFNDGLFAIVPNDAKPETGLVRYESDTLEISENNDYQRSGAAPDLFQSLSLTLIAA